MENTNTTDLIIHKLLERVRVVTLGGIAVISHGLSRNTHDVDVWAEPLESPGHWATRLEGILFPSQSVFPIVIGTWEPVAQGELESVIARDGVVRVAGLDRPLDIFRNPNELDIVRYLREMANYGNPFARDILIKRNLS